MQKLFLEEIIDYKKQEVENRKRLKPLENLSVSNARKSSRIQSFSEAIARSKNQGLSLIAEIKKASPSKGTLRDNFYPDQIAKIYERQGASAISVLTDQKFFQGSLEDLETVTNTVLIPVLRKDFIVDQYQIYEAKAYGAKAILLIVAALNKEELKSLFDCSKKLELSALVEVHDERELGIALECSAEIIGVNNRDLKTFQVDLSVCERLVQKMPSNTKVVVESGLMTREDVLRISELPVDAVLIGEAFMSSQDIAGKMKELMGND